MTPIHLAGCVIPDRDGRILLLHRNTPQRVQWETPGGKVDPGETSQVAAIREVREELGVRVDILQELGRRAFNEGERAFEYTWFLARVVDGTPAVQEPQTHDKIGHFTWEELGGMVGELSANARNLVSAHQEGALTLGR